MSRFSIASVLVLTCAAAWADQPMTQADLFRRLIDLERLCTPPPAGERTGMFSSYDRRSRLDDSGQPVDWDANNDWGQFLRQEEDGWDVMAEMNGPGAITRIWSANPHGDIRIVLDGELVIDMPFAELLSGRLEPFSEPLVYRGLNSYVPIGYAQSCRVLCRGSRSYYQINYVQFPPGTAVERFRLELDEAAQAALAEVKRTFESGYTDRQLFAGRAPAFFAEQGEVGPGRTLTHELTGTGTLRALYVALTDRTNPRDLYALHKLVLRIFVDGDKQPAVEAPLCDFFGSGFDLVPFNSLVIGTDKYLEMPLPDRMLGQDRFMYCYFPQPYRSGLRVEIASFSEAKRPIGLMLLLQADTQPPAADALRFHARYRREDPCEVFDYPILEARGRGRIVGCVLNVDCPRATWWGEGDEKIWIDAEKFPSYFGTGTEDYIGDAWGLHPHLRPLQGVTRVAPYGKNSAYRWHIADCINFQRSVRFTLENWQFGREKDTYYGTVVYWYANPGSSHFFRPLTAADVTPRGLRVPDGVEIEDRILDPNWGSLVREVHTGGYELSGGLAALIATDQPVRIEIPSPRARVVRLKLRAVPRRPFETVSVHDAQGRLVGTVQYDRNVTDATYTVGIVRLEEGKNVVTVQCSRPAPLDCWILESPRMTPGAIEAEEVTVLDAGRTRTETEYGTLDWSGGGQLAVTFAGPGDRLVFALPEQAESTLGTLRLHVTAGPDGGRFQARLDNEPLGEPFDTQADTAGLRAIRLGTVTLAKGTHRLVLEALGPSESGRRLGLDAIQLVKSVSPHARECEDLRVVSERDCPHEIQEIDGTSGGAHVFCMPSTRGAWIEFDVPIEQAGTYRLSAVYLRSFDYGIVQAYVDGQAVGQPVDTYSPAITPGLIVPLGERKLTGPGFRFRVEVTDKAQRSPGYFFGVDALIVEPVP